MRMAKKNILLVDDEKNIVEAFQKLLNHSGFDVSTAYDGKGALDLLNTKKFDLLITDIHMTPMNGLQMLEQVPNKKMPILVITANDSMLEKVKQLSINLVGFFSKPMDVSELLKVIKNVSSSKPLKREKACSKTKKK